MNILIVICFIYFIITLVWTMVYLSPDYGGKFEPISIYWPLWIIFVLPVICLKDLWKRIKEAWTS
jgi:hypothetical protein